MGCSGLYGSGRPNILINRVRPGVLLENARRRWLVSMLIAVDLPAFERPTNATSGAIGAGSWSSRAAEVKNEARCSRDTIGGGYGWLRTLLYNPAFARVGACPSAAEYRATKRATKRAANRISSIALGCRSRATGPVAA